MSPQWQAARERQLSVLIAERYRTIADSLEQVVRALGVAKVAATVTDAVAAIEAAKSLAPDVAIVDLDLSATCSLVSGLHSLSPDTRIIVMAERDSPPELLLGAFESGAVGALYKETSLEELSRALHSSSRATPTLPGEATGLLLSSYLDALQDKRVRDLATIEALAAAVEVRDATTGHHLDRVTELARTCLEHIDRDLAGNEEIAYGFMLHDIGKIGVPDAVLNKPGPLNEDEWSVMRKHPEIGVRIVQPIGFSNTTTDIILCHHEHWDGGGYPNRLAGDEIPITARAFSVADAYDAMTTDRPYRSAMAPNAALGALRELSGRVFDPAMVDLFIDVRN